MNKNKNLLIIAGSFPPSGTSTSMRATNIVKFLYKNGYDISVLTVDKKRATFRSIYDKTLVDKLPKNVKIYRSFGGPISYFLRKMKSDDNVVTLEQIRKKTRNYLIPDAWIEWLPFALIKLFRLNLKNKFDIIITIAYPFTSHIIGYFAHILTKAVWIVDFGDPWCYSPEFEYKYFSRIINKQLEMLILRNANLITVTTNETKNLYKKIYPFIESKIKVISMGYDENDFNKIIPQKFNKFTLLYTGNVYKPHRNPIQLFKAFSKIKRNYPHIYENIQFILLGHVEENIKKSLLKYDIKDSVFIYNWVPFEESISYMLGCDVLVSFGNIGGVQIPGKIYNYFRSNKPILLLSQEQVDPTVNMTLDINRGLSVSNNVEEIIKVIILLYDLYNINQLDVRFNLLKDSVKKYSWEEIIRSLNQEIEKLFK